MGAITSPIRIACYPGACACACCAQRAHLCARALHVHATRSPLRLSIDEDVDDDEDDEDENGTISHSAERRARFFGDVSTVVYRAEPRTRRRRRSEKLVYLIFRALHAKVMAATYVIPMLVMLNVLVNSQ